jgi:hypothetical protein
MLRSLVIRWSFEGRLRPKVGLVIALSLSLMCSMGVTSNGSWVQRARGPMLAYRPDLSADLDGGVASSKVEMTRARAADHGLGAGTAVQERHRRPNMLSGLVISEVG